MVKEKTEKLGCIKIGASKDTTNKLERQPTELEKIFLNNISDKAHFRILAWRIPWTEEPVRLRSMGLHRVRQD